MTTRGGAALGWSTIVAALALGACAPLEGGADGSAPRSAASVFDAPAKPGPKADAIALAEQQACAESLWGEVWPGLNVDGEIEGLMETVGACRAVAILEAERNGEPVSVVEASRIGILAANEAIEAIEFHDDFIGGLPVWQRVRSDAPDEPVKVHRCAHVEAIADQACVDERGRIVLGPEANPTEYRASFELNGSMLLLSEDDAWLASLEAELGRGRRNALAMMGLSAIGTVAAGALTFAAYRVGVNIPMLAGPEVGLIVKGGVAPLFGYAALRSGLSMIGRAKLAARGELALSEYVTCRCEAPGLKNRYHTEKVGFWENWRDFDDAELTARCYDDAIGRAREYDEARCEAAFLR